MGGRIALACALLVAAGSAAAETVKLENGDRVSGEIVETTDTHVILESPVLGRIEIPREQIVVKAEDAGLFGWGLLRGWRRRLTLGASGTAGNTEQMAVNAALDLSTEDSARRWKFAASYFWGSNNGREETNKAFVDIERDWKLPDSSLYLFARGGYDFDSFRSFDHRFRAALGVGYWWLDGGAWRLGSRLGAGGSYTFVGETALHPEASLGVDSIWNIAEGHSFEVHSDVFLDVEAGDEFRTRSTADWNFALTEMLGFSVGVIHDYVSDTARRNNDLTYRGALTVDF